jgi:hypothetical protein
MKTTLYILLFVLSCDAIAQDTLSKWSWGVVGGVEQMGRSLTDVNDNQDVVDQWNSLEENVWRLSGGLRVQRTLSNHLSLYTGLNYADRGYRIDTLQDAGINTLDFHFRYVEIPVGVFYSGLKFGKNSLLAGAAVNMGLSINDVVYYNKNGQTAQFEMQAVSNVNPFVVNVSAALGVRRAITNTANLDVYFNGNQSLTPLSEGSLERRLNSVGLFLAVTSAF